MSSYHGIDIDAQELLDNNELVHIKLYRMLYTGIIDFQQSLPLSESQYTAVFQEAFLIFARKLRAQAGAFQRFSEPRVKTWMLEGIKQILQKLLFQPGVSPAYLLAQVRDGNAEATTELARQIADAGNWKYAATLLNTLHIMHVEADDQIQDALLAFIQSIREGGFMLDAGLKPEIALKKCHAYYREILFRQIHKLYRKNKHQVSGDPVERLSTDFNQEEWTDWDQPSIDDDTTFKYQVYRCFHLLDPGSQKILRWNLVDKWSPKEICKKLNDPMLPTTQHVVEKKMAALQKLKQLMQQSLGQLNQAGITRMQRVVRSILDKLVEPCRTILNYALPPNNWTYEAIAGELKNRLSKTEFTSVETTEQIKKRKYKCLQSMQESVWAELLRP